jgi:hypothetical protein
MNAFRAEALRQLEYESVRDRETGEEHQPDTDRFRGQRPAQPIPPRQLAARLARLD